MPFVSATPSDRPLLLLLWLLPQKFKPMDGLLLLLQVKDSERGGSASDLASGLRQDPMASFHFALQAHLHSNFNCG